MNLRTVVFSDAVYALSFSSDYLELDTQSSVALSIQEGEYLSLINYSETESAGVAMFMVDTLGETFCASTTAEHLDRAAVTEGDALLSSAVTPMLVVVRDSAGPHDLGADRASSTRSIAGEAHDLMKPVLARFGDADGHEFPAFDTFVAFGDHRRADAATLALKLKHRSGDELLFRAERTLLVSIAVVSRERSECLAGPIAFNVFGCDYDSGSRPTALY